MKILTLLTILFIAGIGAYMVFTPCKPFWLDEWFIIYNLKFKTAGALWGELDYMQQFPRTYLVLIKKFVSGYGYSYSSLRLPSFVVHMLALLFAYRLSGRLYHINALLRFFWVLIYASFATSLEYFVQIKQYTMEMLLGLVSLWQLLELTDKEKKPRAKFALLCLSFIVAPFFSYTYPIVVAPVYLVCLVRLFITRENRKHAQTLLPLALGICSIAVFYAVDVRHVMQDKGMQNYWQEYLMSNGFSASLLFTNIYKFFANPGAGDLFQIIYAVLGIASWLLFTYITIKRLKHRELNAPVAYAVSLVWLMLLLFIAGKLPFGTHRLNAFATPALAILIISLLDLPKAPKAKNATQIIALALSLAAIGNIIPTLINDLTSDEHKKKLAIYNATGEGVAQAAKENEPVFALPDVAYPYHTQVKGDWVVKTHPGYNVARATSVYNLSTADSAQYLLKQYKLPSAIIIGERTWQVVQPH